MTRHHALPLLVGVATLLVSACGTGASTTTSNGTVPTIAQPHVVSTPQHPSITYAIAHGQDLGPVDASTQLHITLGLIGRNQVALAALLGQGGHVSPEQYAQEFGPDPQAVAGVSAALRQRGISTTWSGGDTTMHATGSASAMDSVFNVRIDNRIGPDGIHFFAPAREASVPSSLATVVNSVTGLNNYPSISAADIRDPNGVSPSDIMSFYDVTPLRTAGLDGTGVTIAFPEIDQFDPAMLSQYAKKFKLPPFNVQTAPMNNGQPGKEEGEADLDLEIVHAVAPMAKEVVYYSSAQPSDVYGAEQAMYKDFPNGAIESSSVGGCEAPGMQNQNDAMTIGDAQQAASAKGWSIFVASGDRGAFDCAPGGDFNDIAADLDASVPYVTAVGGTLLFLASNGGYYKEAAWGEPVEQWGGSGGVSEYWPLPSWQKAPGVQNQYSNGSRETPDVSGDADQQSGWDIFAQGSEEKVGGTSAAAPYWAAITALIDQDLKQKNLPLVGFANPALYTFAQNPAGLPVPPYHDITQGTNLYYPATPNYDLATGLGSADIGALAEDFEWYARGHPSS